MIGEWDNPWSLITPEGTLPFNDTDGTTGWRFQLVPRKCSAVLPVRTTEDDRPQGDGKIPHRRWRSGYRAHLAIELLVGELEDADCAGGEDLVGMLDLLGLHINAMIRTGLAPGFPNARLQFSPTGASDDRMFDRIQLAGDPVASLEGDLGGTLVEVDLDTPYPYYIAKTEESTVIADTGTEIITNDGNTDYFPVIHIAATTSAFTITNLSVVDLDADALDIVYSSSLPGASAISSGYVEIINFLGTAFLNGSGANRLAGVDFRYTEFFPLIPGDNEITVAGATVTVLSNDAWA